jgi:hypothetical protein
LFKAVSLSFRSDKIPTHKHGKLHNRALRASEQGAATM